MLGVFDSGFGGLTVLRAIHAQLPHLSTVYLGDNARAPYGTRTHDEIFHLTLEGVRFLFAQGCPLVILACNSASAQALRQIQTDVLPNEFPDRRVLGVIRPTVEALTQASHSGHIGIVATQATVNSNAYVHEFNARKDAASLTIHQSVGHHLVELVEAGEESSPEALAAVQDALKGLDDEQIDHILLGCTHYPLLEQAFREAAGDGVKIVSQNTIIADKLEDYLKRHPEMLERMDQSGTQSYFSTSKASISELASRFYGEDVKFKQVEL